MSKVLEERDSAKDDFPLISATAGTKRRTWGMVVIGVVGGSLVTLYAVVTPFIIPALRRVCLPFVPATSTQIENVLKMLQSRSGSVADVGSGDGRIVIAAAKEGFPAVGYELNPWLVWYSRYRAWRQGVQHNAKFYRSDLWKMLSLERKLETELKDNARVIACRFPFPHWIPNHITGRGVDTVWTYDFQTFRRHDERYLDPSPPRPTSPLTPANKE
ncbi:ATP synthase subunit C lysine N-methyltransferase isoform X2 [Rhinatrema bivittatum]|uniref:ATP synthase subunit C lysine N-methyltransferase isoform X2 n=1 Tax=Rhinatrema bivittatum TaxID=194408 RepID=UPI0011286848|nr:ATP synthase subunit C lysine N-methyltransferase isoform X2 [Rhinatrema bivittatum]